MRNYGGKRGLRDCPCCAEIGKAYDRANRKRARREGKTYRNAEDGIPTEFVLTEEEFDSAMTYLEEGPQEDEDIRRVFMESEVPLNLPKSCKGCKFRPCVCVDK